MKKNVTVENQSFRIKESLELFSVSEYKVASFFQTQVGSLEAVTS